MLIVLFLVLHFNFLFVPCGGLSWLPVSFLLHAKYTLSYRIVSYRISAVAERPRDALWPSLVSLNKIITGADSFIIVTLGSDLPLRNVVFGVTLRLLIIQFVVVSHHQQTRPLTID